MAKKVIKKSPKRSCGCQRGGNIGSIKKRIAKIVHTILYKPWNLHKKPDDIKYIRSLNPKDIVKSTEDISLRTAKNLQEIAKYRSTG